MNGTVKWFNKKKGYGFIKGEDEKDYFVHYTSVPRGVFLREEDTVTFDPVENEKGLQAQNVQKTGSGNPAPRGPRNFPRENHGGSEHQKPQKNEGEDDDEQHFEGEENFGEEDEE